MKKVLFGTVRRKVAVLTLGALLVTGVAFAAWTITTATAPAGGKVGSLTAPTVQAATLNNGAACFPGTACDLNVKVTNPNSGAMTITGVVSPPQSGATTSDTVNCPYSGNFTVNSLTLATPVTLPPGATDNIVLPGAVTLASTAPSGCQGVTFTAKVQLTIST